MFEVLESLNKVMGQIYPYLSARFSSLAGGGMEMKKVFGLLLILVIAGMVLSSGCMGGGGSKTSTQSSSTYSHSSTMETSTTSTTQTGATTSQTTTTSSSETTATSSTTTTETTTTSQTTTTSTATEEAYWEHPWEYAPVEVNGHEYRVVGYTVTYKVRPDTGEPLYEYRIQKSVKRTKIHVYGMDMTGNTVDLGEKEVYEYTTVVTPIKGEKLDDKLILRLWFTSEANDVFIYPWNLGWMAFINPYGGGNASFVGLEMEYKGESFKIISPAAYQQGLLPSMEGDSEWMEEINDDLTNLYMGWFAVVSLGLWSAWQDVNLLVPQSGTWSDGVHSWEWSTKPDGTVTFSGVRFKLVEGQWKYEGSDEEVTLKGDAKFSPYLFLPVEVNGYFTYRDSETGKMKTIYGYFKIEDLKLEKVG